MAVLASLNGTESGLDRAEAGQAVSLARVERSALAVLAARVAAAGCAYVAQVLMARLMGGSEYGVFATAWVWIAILGHASTWGFGQAACRFVPAYRAAGDEDAARGFLGAGALVALAGGALVALTGALVLVLARDWLEAGRFAPFLLALLVVPVFALQDFAEGAARGFGWPLLAIAPPYLVRQALVMGAMALALRLGAPAEAWVAVAATLAATGLALALQATVLLRRLALVLPGRGRTAHWVEWRRVALPLALVDLAGSGLVFVDVLALGLVMPPAAVGVYFAATRLLQFVVFVQFAASAATNAHFADAQARGDRAGLEALVRRRAQLATLATLLVGGCVLLASPLLLGLFGPDFAGATPVLAVLIAGALAQSALGPADDLLTMLGGERATAAVSCAAVAAAGGLVLVVAPAFGTVGAAAAMAAAGTARAAWLAALARGRLGIATPVFAGLLPPSGRAA
jgi:O-antigen/teichoic acid export membrane protein